MPSINYKKLFGYFIGTMFLLLPFSVAINFGGHQLELMSEPLLFVTGSLGLYYAYRKQAWRMPFLKHPLFWVLAAYITWGLICTVFANHFYISAKYSLVTVAHWWVYFCLWAIIFSKIKINNSPWLLYSLSFVLILFYAWWQHSQYGFSVDTSVLVARPFYFDHALYSATALLLLGMLAPLAWGISKQFWSWVFKLLSLLLLLGVYLSFSRAAWLSLFGALFLTSMIAYFRPSFKQFLAVSSFFFIVIIIGLSILVSRKENQVLSKQGDSWQHLRSTLNVSTDVSNLERLNRYSCAWRMFKTKPIFGYGPGNFIIDYYPFQRPEEMTRLSVTKHQKHRPGKGGGSHSQYLQTLSEMGIIGFLLWVSLILMSIRTGIQIVKTSNNPFYRQMALGIIFGLLTFFIHSLFNNFFHQEKVMALVWSGMATLILMDEKGRRSIMNEWDND